MLGTDHHRFDRLIEWIDRWASDRGGAVDVLVQHGASKPPRHAAGEGFMPHASMLSALEGSAAVVCHGGTGSAMEARRHGFLPVIVPRTRRLGEAVDDHQIEFARLMERKGDARVAWTEEQMRGWLDQVVTDPGALRSEPNGNGVQETVRRFEALVAPLAGRSPKPSLPVLYIGGMGRSGSTLLERVLGEVPDVVSVGELDNLWIRGLAENDLCGCGQRFRACPFWSEVGERAFGGWDMIDPDVALDLRLGVARHRYIPLMLLKGMSPSFEVRLQRFGRMLGSLYRAIGDVSGAKVIIDSSKQASYAYLVRLLAAVDLRVVHMIRDAHGVTYSWTKQVRRPEVLDGQEFMQTYHPGRMALRWNVQNLLFEILPRMGIPTMRLFYEDFVQQLVPEVRRVLRFAGVPDADLSYLEDESASLGTSHTVSGNPMRFQTGKLKVRTDSRWREAMPRKDQRLVTALTWPFLAGYRYPPTGKRGALGG